MVIWFFGQPDLSCSKALFAEAEPVAQFAKARCYEVQLVQTKYVKAKYAYTDGSGNMKKALETKEIIVSRFALVFLLAVGGV